MHARGLLRVRAGADAEDVVRLADAELLEEDLRHRVVVVLAGVDEHVLEARRAAGAARARTGAVFMKFGRVPTTDEDLLAPSHERADVSGDRVRSGRQASPGR